MHRVPKKSTRPSTEYSAIFLPSTRFCSFASTEHSSASEYRARLGYRGSLTRHIRSHIRDKPNASKSYQCNVTPCTKSFYTLDNLRGHIIRVHKSEKRFRCDFEECTVTCKSKTALKVHKVTHTGQKNFKCGQPNCGKAYTTKGALTHHNAAVHVAARLFWCYTCSKGFFTKGALARHVKYVHDNVEPKFECTFCDAKFKEKHGLHRHIVSHVGEKHYPCGKCGVAFGSSGALRNHQFSHPTDKSFPCHFCSKTYKRQGDRHAHVLLAHPTTPHVPSDCPTCGKTFRNGTFLRKHVRLNHGDRTFFCYFCPKVVKNYKANFETHVRRHTLEKPFICPSADGCKYSTGSPADLISHLKCMHAPKMEEDMETCYFCGEKVRKREYDLMSHMRKHTAERAFCCGVCGKMFNSVRKVKGHIDEVHTRGRRRGANSHIGFHIRKKSPSSKSHQCNVTPCTKSFNTPKNLRDHINRVHNSWKRFSCDFQNCAVTCKSKTGIKAHKLTHTREKNFKCGQPNCDKAYTTQGALTHHHAAVHVAARLFKCPTCSKGFFTKPGLRQHVRDVHETVEAKFECSLCPAKFKEKNVLYTNIISHIGEKPYSCGTCSAGFRTSDSPSILPSSRQHVLMPILLQNVFINEQAIGACISNWLNRTFFCYFCPKVVKNYKANFEIHVRRHTLEKPFVCTECKYSTGSPSCLVSHVRWMHPPISEETCHFCGEKVRRLDLMSHIRKHTAEKAFCCGVCGKMFNSVGKVKGHIDEVHSRGRRAK
ncbi:Zinc finger protein 62 [Folsomia candida]|uniref:Zinc finger protein 62 n=1 Tax=Folsomia candida TaxID=158441 RepID=A0A226DKR4_FOLCA|nr:Zinc finger protein 62 [Folsomia candida]